MIWMGVGGPRDWDALGNRFPTLLNGLRIYQIIVLSPIEIEIKGTKLLEPDHLS